MGHCSGFILLKRQILLGWSAQIVRERYTSHDVPIVVHQRRSEHMRAKRCTPQRSRALGLALKRNGGQLPSNTICRERVMNTSKNGWIPKVEIRWGQGSAYLPVGIALLGAAGLVAATLFAQERQAKPAISRVAPASALLADQQGSCGDGNLDTGETCDPGSPGVPCASPSTCRQAGDPLQCTCTPACGNGDRKSVV